MLVIFYVALLPLFALYSSCYPVTDTDSSEETLNTSQPALDCNQATLQKLETLWKEKLEQYYTWLDSDSNAFRQFGPSIFEASRETENGCERYEENKNAETYGCFSKDFFCSAKKVVLNIDAAYRHVKNYIKKNQPWRHHFQVPPGYQQGVWASPLTDDLRWAVKMRWHDPKLAFLTKTDNHEQLTNQTLDRMYFYLKTNNVDEVASLFQRYQEYGVEEIMDEQCADKNGNPLPLPCKIAIVFDSISGLVRDNKAIGWDGRSSPPRTREELAILYLLQPQIYKIMSMSDTNRQEVIKFRLTTMFRSFYDNALEKKTEKFKNHFGKFDNIQPIMKRDCNETYNNNLDELTCYLSETFKRLNELKIALGTNYDKWEEPKAKTRNVVVILWLLLTPKACEYIEPNETDLIIALKKLLEIFYRKIQEKGLTSVRYILSMLPPENEIGLDSSVVCRPTFEEFATNVKCAYTIMMENIIMFLDDFQSKDGKKVNKLDMSIDYRYRLEQFKISSIHGAVINTKLELQSSLHEFSRQIRGYFEASIDNRFKHLRDYFTNVASFDEEITQADTIFITSKLDEFEATAAHIEKQLFFDAKYLQQDALIGTAIDATFMWFKAAARAASAIFDAISGDFGGIVDAMDAMDEAMQSTLQAVKAAAVIEQIKIATSTFQDIRTKLTINREQLENTRRIINKLSLKDYDNVEFKRLRDDFIKSYNDYTPMVNEAEIAKLDTAWNTIIDNLDDQLSSLQTVAGISATMHNHVENHVFKIQILVPQLEATLSARFEYQFDLMDSLAGTMRAHNSMQAAKSLSEGFEDPEKQTETSLGIEFALDNIALTTYIISQFHLLLTLKQYCHYITYVNVGIQPEACKKALATLNNAHIDEALSYQPPSCDMINVNLKIPTSETGETENINVRHLNSGDKVQFQIPDFNWLKENADISPEDENSGLYVKMFEIYVMKNSSYKLNRTLRVDISASGPARISNTSDELKYELRPRSRAKYIFEYKENYGTCKGEMNPYHVCTPGPKQLCVQSRGAIENKIGLYPSIYSPWTIQLNRAIGHAPKPEDTRKLFLQAKLKLCRKIIDSDTINIDASGDVASGSGWNNKYKKHRRIIRSLLEPETPSCPPQKYFDQRSGQFENCADGTPQHFGYYCGSV
ncbi:uncharacterized protein LOC114524829 [Dendronephthya gigantea]|uniref:uncharacterized protein LOC114524829 n=1 Tax=Dendronephthya gigantea TaxID=151771 RepID=UPI00106D5413|nr:uncharacterized protein LOC114524829 [Dendronephthya gigantea]